MLNFFRVVPKRRNVRIKKSSGLIFSNPSKHRKLIFYIANMLLVLTFFYGIYLYIPLLSAVYKYKFSNNTQNNSPTINSIVSDEYIIQIPKILAYSKVIANVSPYDQAEYDRVLKNNVVAQAKDTDNPGGGEGKSTYIFAHSSNNNLAMVRSNAVFYLLGELQNDDLVYINYQKKEFKYKVFDKKVISAGNLEYLNYHNPNKETLILQTCWPIGTDWNRLIVLAERI